MSQVDLDRIAVPQNPESPKSMQPNKVASTTKGIFYGLLIVAVGGFYFFLNLLDNYIALHNKRDTFYFDLLPLFAFLALTIGALIALLYSVLRRKKNPASTMYLLVFVICACTSFLFRVNLSDLADRVFFWANETSFKTKTRNGSSQHPATIVFTRSSVNFHKLIIHSTGQINDGALSLATIDALGTELSGLRGCEIDSKALQDSFYVLRAYC
jgi:hypothetical protein